jgi:hypothetical protein
MDEFETDNAITKSIEFCCLGFKELTDRAGQRGPSVIVLQARSQNRLKFRLQSRGIAYKDEADFKKLSIPIEVNIRMTDAIAYCPYCGSHLQELLEASPAEYAELATKHKPFATMPGDFSET